MRANTDRPQTDHPLCYQLAVGPERRSRIRMQPRRLLFRDQALDFLMNS